MKSMGFNVSSFDKKVILIFGGLISIIVLYYYLVSAPAQRKFEQYARYTIATITKTQSPTRGSCRLYYDYQVDGKSYSGSSIFSCEYLRSYAVGKKIIVKYSSLDPNENYCLNEVFAPDSMIPPVNGWKELPRLKNQLK